MKRLIVFFVLVFGFVLTGTVSAANSVFGPGHWEFEDWIPNMTYTGTWNTNTDGARVTRTTTGTNASVNFTLSKSTEWVVFYRVTTTTTGTFKLCYNAAFTICTTYANTTTNTTYRYPFTVYYGGSGSDVDLWLVNTAGSNLVLDDFFVFAFIPTATPANTPVPTATILPSSTPGVPTATILPSSTPANTPVDTATAVPTATPPNTPVPTATAVPTATPFDINLILTLIGSGGNTLTPTNTPTITNTPTPEPWVYITVTSGQLTRFDYVATASDVHIANLLALIFFSVWGFFLFTVFVLARYKK